MLLHVFFYYPLGLLISILIGVTALKYVNIDPPPGLIIVFIIIMILIGISHLSQIYKALLQKDKQRKV